MITLDQYNQDRDSILKECVELEILAANMKLMFEKDLNIRNIAVYVETKCQALREVFEARQQKWNEELSRLEIEYAEKLYQERRHHASHY